MSAGAAATRVLGLMPLVLLASCADTIFTTYRADYAELVPSFPVAQSRSGTAAVEFDFGHLDRAAIISAVKRGAPPTRDVYPSVWQHPYAWQGGINTAIALATLNAIAASYDVVSIRFSGLEEWDLDRRAIAAQWKRRPEAVAETLIRVVPRTIAVTRFGYVQGGLLRADAISEEIELSLGLAITVGSGRRHEVGEDVLYWRQSGRMQSPRSTILLTESLLRDLLPDLQRRLDRELRTFAAG